jgi:hypothetical protein
MNLWNKTWATRGTCWSKSAATFIGTRRPVIYILAIVYQLLTLSGELSAFRPTEVLKGVRTFPPGLWTLVPPAGSILVTGAA